MISAREVLAAKTATPIWGTGGHIDKTLSHMGNSFKALDTPHMSKAIDAFGHTANMAAGVGAVAAPILSSVLPSADMKIQQQMHKQNRAAKGPAPAPAAAV